MAAGMGSRYGGIKQIEPVGLSGEAIMDYSVYDALRAGFGRIVFIIRREIEADIREFIGGRFEGRAEVRYAYQERDMPPGRTKPWGTAHAVLCARSEAVSPFTVINADDFYGRDAFRVMARYLESPDRDTADFAMAGYRLGNTLSEHGSVSRGICTVDPEGFLVSIEEHLQIEKTRRGIVSRSGDSETSLTGGETVSMNMFGFTPRIFPLLEREFSLFLENRGDDPAAECYIPAVVGTLVSSGEARVRVLPSSASWFGVTYQADKAVVQEGIRRLVRAGEYPERLW